MNIFLESQFNPNFSSSVLKHLIKSQFTVSSETTQLFFSVTSFFNSDCNFRDGTRRSRDLDRMYILLRPVRIQ